ncbi:hypothetical protein [Larkinella terrae]|uniref:Uncharacterized protein n=1 Tax=Larkinella terrae TaxID=2025311 RepID=A0A7K0EIR2_9BACT|nr:hypothetical protein [Larkinella terrae]MRS61740.1 hypothetical protein [Larkinella terrae]
MYKFSLKIDDPVGTLSEENGISIYRLSQLLRNLNAALRLQRDSNCTLSAIQGNCYQVDVSTSNRVHHDEFIELMGRAEKREKVPAYQKKLLNNLLFYVRKGYFIEAYDTDNDRVAVVTKDRKPVRGNYYITDSVTGEITRIGNRQFNYPSSIVISQHEEEIPFTVPISDQQDQELRDYYKNGTLQFEVRFKIDKYTKKRIPIELVAFKVKSSKTLLELVNDFNAKHPDLFTKNDPLDLLLKSRQQNDLYG